MTHYTCDICRSEISVIYERESPAQDPDSKQGSRVLLPKSADDYMVKVWSFSWFDLCPKCIRSLAEWLQKTRRVS